MERHLIRCQSDYISCPDCGKMIKECSLQQHQRLHEMWNDFYCRDCKLACGSVQEYIDHSKTPEHKLRFKERTQENETELEFVVQTKEDNMEFHEKVFEVPSVSDTEKDLPICTCGNAESCSKSSSHQHPHFQCDCFCKRKSQHSIPGLSCLCYCKQPQVHSNGENGKPIIYCDCKKPEIECANKDHLLDLKLLLFRDRMIQVKTITFCSTKATLYMWKLVKEIVLQNGEKEEDVKFYGGQTARRDGLVGRSKGHLRGHDSPGVREYFLNPEYKKYFIPILGVHTELEDIKSTLNNLEIQYIKMFKLNIRSGHGINVHFGGNWGKAEKLKADIKKFCSESYSK